jgi:hypothetical protein
MHAMNHRETSDLGWFLLAWPLAFVLVIAAMYAIVTFASKQTPERFAPPAQSESAP